MVPPRNGPGDRLTCPGRDFTPKGSQVTVYDDGEVVSTEAQTCLLDYHFSSYDEKT